MVKLHLQVQDHIETFNFAVTNIGKTDLIIGLIGFGNIIPLLTGALETSLSITAHLLAVLPLEEGYHMNRKMNLVKRSRKLNS